MEKHNYEFLKVLVVSTAHITEETSKMLNENPCYASDDYGYFVFNKANWKGDEPFYNNLYELEPTDLKQVFELAQKLSCTYIRFDQDGPIYPDLKTYEW